MKITIYNDFIGRFDLNFAQMLKILSRCPWFLIIANYSNLFRIIAKVKELNKSLI